MLDLADYSIALLCASNAAQAVKRDANYQAPANSENGLLQVLEWILAGRID